MDCESTLDRYGKRILDYDHFTLACPDGMHPRFQRGCISVCDGDALSWHTKLRECG